MKGETSMRCVVLYRLDSGLHRRICDDSEEAAAFVAFLQSGLVDHAKAEFVAVEPAPEPATDPVIAP